MDSNTNQPSEHQGAAVDVGSGPLLAVLLKQRDRENAEILAEAVKVEEDRNALLRAMEEIERECSGALNNAMPEDAPDTLAHVGGIAARVLKERRKCYCENGIIRSLGRDNDEIIEDCPRCSSANA